MKRTLIAALGLTLVAGAANAQMMGRRPDPDLDRDGKVTLVEFKRSQADAMMSRLDADKDGRISKAEVEKMTAMARTFRGEEGVQRVATLIARLDGDRDGGLTRAEIETGASLRFNIADTNRDGWLSKGELLTLQQNRTREG